MAPTEHMWNVHKNALNDPVKIQNPPFNPRPRRMTRVPFRRTPAVACICLLLLFWWTFSGRDLGEESSLSLVPRAVDPWDSSLVLKGAPTSGFRDNLVPGVQYLTAWPTAGWTNDVMSMGHIIYLAALTNRVPIIPMFVPSHVGAAANYLPFGEVFNMTYLRAALHVPVLEWSEVKNLSSKDIDDIGCWSLWQAVTEGEAPRPSYFTNFSNIDISWTEAPAWTKYRPNNDADRHTSFHAAASLTFSENRNKSLKTPTRTPISNKHYPPDEQLACFDCVYFLTSLQNMGGHCLDYDYCPGSWLHTTTHFRFTERLKDIAQVYVRRTLEVAEGSVTPHYISLHVRRGDFLDKCENKLLIDCLPPLSAFARRVFDVKEELLERKGIDVKHVIMTSDDKSPEFWQEVKDLGWYAIDHSNTTVFHSAWYPVLIDAIVQSEGHGFVGTASSTMSSIAYRRVREWENKGAARMVHWGSGADDH